MAQHGKPCVAAVRLRFREPAAERGLGLQDLEQRRRRVRREEALRLAVAERLRFRAHDRKLLERRCLLAPLEIVRYRGAYILEADPRIGVVDHDQTLAVGIRQRPQEKTIEQAEYGR